ncbi:MAG: sortase [Candidatus Nomurabacteria bacterium]|nr:MAG: sortase [Candidatus Nomurabacteria bacterium]HRV76367.1 sortase [Candidatus Saccharimonadales bacterium]
MSRRNQHFGIDHSRPDPEPVGRPKKDSHELSVDDLHKRAAEEYARRGVERVYAEQAKKRAKNGGQVQLDKEQLEHYHKSWQEYWQQYYHQYYSDYYDKYFGEVKGKVDEHHQKAQAKLVEMYQDNKKLVNQKKRLEDPEAIRRDLINRVVERGKESSFWSKARRHVRALSAAATVVFLFLFIQFNPIVVGAVKQYLGPAGSASLPSIIEPSSSSSVNKNPTIIIPKIGVKTPVVYDEPSPYNEPVQKALERGVVRYWNTASPGEIGNVAILGHSSNNLLNAGKYKYVFVNLKKLQTDDVIYLDYEGIRYAYKVTETKILPPEDLSYIQPTEVPSVTLITCDPPGTAQKRLYIRAIQISPDPSSNKKTERSNQLEEEIKEVPNTAPSFWSRFF